MVIRFVLVLAAGLFLIGAAAPDCGGVVEDRIDAAIEDGAGAPPVAATVPLDTNFLSVCRFSHRASDDPIVAPNLPGGSHSHDFFGNQSTNNASTYGSLVANTVTTCNRPGDTAAYWAPSLLEGGRIVQPLRINAYYRTGGKDPATIQAFPPGLKVVAGNSKAASPQDLRIVSWGCAMVAGAPPPSASPVACPYEAGRNGLKLRIRFMDCWDGVHLDSADHAGHMAYSRRGSCPATHPVPVPALTMNVVYPSAGGPGVVLASGNSPFTGHADFFNAWDTSTLQTLVANCLNAAVHCGARGGGVPLRRDR